jgi:hypothetical protein
MNNRIRDKKRSLDRQSSSKVLTASTTALTVATHRHNSNGGGGINSSTHRSTCVFCEKCTMAVHFTFMINRALFSKFSASQNYYFTKDINDLISGGRTAAVIKIRDLQNIDEEVYVYLFCC